MGITALHVHITDFSIESRDSKDVDNGCFQTDEPDELEATAACLACGAHACLLAIVGTLALLDVSFFQCRRW